MNTWRSGPAFSGTHRHKCAKLFFSFLRCFFFFLIFYKTMCPRQTGHCKLSPRPCGVKGRTPGMSSCQPHKSHMPSAQGQRESGFGWRPALPPQTLGLCFSQCLQGKEREMGLTGGRKASARDGACPPYLTKNMWYYPMVMVMPMMTAKMSTVTETQMAIMTFFCERGRVMESHSGKPTAGAGDEAYLPRLLLVL